MDDLERQKVRGRERKVNGKGWEVRQINNLTWIPLHCCVSPHASQRQNTFYIICTNMSKVMCSVCARKPDCTKHMAKEFLSSCFFQDIYKQVGVTQKCAGQISEPGDCAAGEGEEGVEIKPFRTRALSWPNHMIPVWVSPICCCFGGFRRITLDQWFRESDVFSKTCYGAISTSAQCCFFPHWALKASYFD